MFYTFIIYVSDLAHTVRSGTDPDIREIYGTRIRGFNIWIRIRGFRISDIRLDILLPADIRIQIRKNN